MTEPKRPSLLLRALNAVVYGGFAALGAGLVGRPAALSLAGFGLVAPRLAWTVPLGGLFVFLFVCLAALLLPHAWPLALGLRARMGERAALLIAVGLAFALRMAVPAPRPPEDPGPLLVEALRVTANALDRDYVNDKSYRPDAAKLSAEVAPLGRTGFVHHGRPLELHVQVLDGPERPQVAPVAAPPGTVLVSLSPARQRALVWVLTPDGLAAAPLRKPKGAPVIVVARSGSHGSPGRDPLMPDYPGWQPVHAPGAE
ncbi:MAG: hypothetical protein JST92_27730 [Deltaproteobacteria bacterium]|nr:hypothetical protein [Deltaproteobacteria bacterium]